MNFFKKNYSILPLLLLFALSISYFSGLFDDYLDIKDKTSIQNEKPYFLKKLDYLSSFIIPSIEEDNDFDKLLESEPTAAVANLSAITTTITQEAVKSFTTPSEHPLPLLAHYNTGDIGVDEGMTPDYMISLIEEGNHILPSWKLEPYWKQPLSDDYYKNSILRAKELNLPLTFVMDPVEKTLTEDSLYFTKASAENPNVIDLNSNTLEKISPLGPDTLWSDIGHNFAQTDLMKKIQQWYPNPPLIMFVDNANAKKLNWTDLESSRRYVDRYGSTTDENFKRTVTGAQWIEKYRLLHEGIKNSFTSDTWKSNTKFIAYNPIALDIGTTSNWKNNATLTNQHFSSWPLTTDGINVEYFTNGLTTSINKNIFNINNIPFILQEAYKQNSGFSHQLSVADLDTFDTSDKYRGFTQLGLWLTRPNIVREFNSETNDKTVITPHFQSVIDSIELIHNDDRLQNFWKNGELVANPTASIEQLLDVPSYYADADKWFLLDVDVNPAPEWTLDTHLPVYAIALETGVAPNREWLLLVQSFDGDQSDISVTIPGYQDVLVNASESGNLYMIGESAQEQVVAINKSVANTNNTSIYIEPVDIPTYDPTNNTHILITPENGMWNDSVLNDPTKQHFYVEPGDYLSSKVTLTSSGIQGNRRTISLYNNANPLDNIHPAKLLDEEQASVNITFDGASYWTIDRLSNINDTSDPSFLIENNSTNNILNRLHLKNYYTGIIVLPFCHNNTIQNSYLNGMSHKGRVNDRVGIAVASAGIEHTKTFGTKIINNDIRNALDGIQLVLSSGLSDVSYDGTIIDSNRVWIDSDIYTNGDYSTNGYNPIGKYMIAENAMDIKAGSGDSNNPLIITNNIMYGYREVDITAQGSYSGGSGTAFVVHYGTENVIFEDNIIYDCQSAFIASARIDAKPFSIANWSIKNNIFSDINLINPLDKQTFAMYVYHGKDIKIENNIFNNIQQNSLGSGFFFRYEDTLGGCTFKNNVAIDSHGTSSWYNHDDANLNDGVSIIDIDNNYFYASTETLKGDNIHTFTRVEESEMEIITINTTLLKENNSTQLYIRTTELSPHKNLFNIK